MKKLKKIMCFILMLTFCWSFSACKNKDNSPDNGNQIEDPLPDSGSEPEVFVPLTMDDIIGLGEELNDDFFANFEQDLFNGSFEVNILGMKEMFLNANDMLGKISGLNTVSHGTTYYGETLTNETSDQPNQVNKFFITYSPENSDNYSKLELKIMLSYKSLDVKYTYDYYNIVIETDQKNNTISYMCAIEKSRAFSTNNSTAEFFVFDITCDLKDVDNARDYKVYSFERNKIINENLVNNTNIVNYSKSEFDGENKEYMSTVQGETELRNTNSKARDVIVNIVADLGQDVKMLQMSGGLKRTGLSDALISCIV